MNWETSLYLVLQLSATSLVTKNVELGALTAGAKSAQLVIIDAAVARHCRSYHENITRVLTTSRLSHSPPTFRTCDRHLQNGPSKNNRSFSNYRFFDFLFPLHPFILFFISFYNLQKTETEILINFSSKIHSNLKIKYENTKEKLARFKKGLF